MISQFTLDNGLQVICDPMPEFSSVAFGVWVKAGTLDENNDQAGLAHLLEHMAFKGTGKRSAFDIAVSLEDVGASLDAATSHQRTAYYARGLVDDLDRMCDLVSDILMDPVFDNEELKREQEVILQEIAEAADDPDDVAFEQLSAKAWGEHPLGQAILGTKESVKAQSPHSLKRFMDTHYCAQNMVLSFSGGISAGEAERLSNQYFSNFVPETKAAQRSKPVYKGGFVHEDKPIAQTHIAVAFPGYGYDDPRYIAARLYADVLGGGMSSRLFQKIREEHGLAYSVYAYADIFDNAGLIGAFIGTGAGEANQSVELLCEEIKAMCDRISVEELDRAKALLRSSMVMGRESVAARAEINAGQMMTFGVLRDQQQILDQIMSVSVDDVRAIALDILEGTRPSLSIVGPLSTPDIYERLCDLT